MRKLIPLMLLAVTVSPFMASEAKAESEVACSIWLCLPAGFPSGCGDAKNEFKNRIRNLKPPLPPLNACIVHTDIGLTNQFEAKRGWYEKCVSSDGRCRTIRWIEVHMNDEKIGNRFYY